ncbi:Bacteriophage P22, NinX [uncultured Caudovirales phage]|uniref:Bacteriophage P22, NinX n=1 Tax=uncultured Caudovirales phage TaxID=2100421 RepID=A0A6J5LLX5_9CAUD|nr:Bacteriophage P22, NinX [uncultured Caudovirales phage]
MKVKTRELTGAALDWAVALAEGFKPNQLYISKYPQCPASIYTRTFDDDGNPDGYITGPDRLYSEKWEAGGPIIERERIVLDFDGNSWCAWCSTIKPSANYGQTALIAAMRCYVASKLGEEVEIPEELVRNG